MAVKPKLDQEALLELKSNIDEAKTKVSELTGQKNALMRQLKEEWGCKTIEEVETKLETIKKQREKLDKEKDTKTQELEKLYFGEDENE